MSPVPARRDESLPADYPMFLGEIKDAVVAARAQAALAVSAITLAAYWAIGSGILAREGEEGALPELPRLASTLTGIADAADVVYGDAEEGPPGE